MSLNSWLCRNFDTESIEGERYVTVGSVAHKISTYLLKMGLCVIIGAITVTLIYICYRGVLFILNGDLFKGDTDPNLVGFLGMFILIAVTIALALTIWDYVSRIKVAKCELKEDKK